MKSWNPKRFTDVMPNSVNLGEVSEGIYELMVKWDFDNACTLTKLGLKNCISLQFRINDKMALQGCNLITIVRHCKMKPRVTPGLFSFFM